MCVCGGVRVCVCVCECVCVRVCCCCCCAPRFLKTKTCLFSQLLLLLLGLLLHLAFFLLHLWRDGGLHRVVLLCLTHCFHSPRLTANKKAEGGKCTRGCNLVLCCRFLFDFPALSANMFDLRFARHLQSLALVLLLLLAGFSALPPLLA